MPPQLAPGAVLAGRYHLAERLGVGGTGAVWRAHDDVLDRGVAVKLLHDEVRPDVAVRERFRREAMAAAAIHHPHAAVVYDIGEDEGRPFLVMELVDGPPLGEVMDGRPVDAGVVAAIGHQVAGALGAAHERGLAHRDVKPANVLLSLDGAAKVVDFGIAKILGEVTRQLTSVGTIVGTAAYLAPEQLDPDSPVDGRADVYALGLLLHELLTGRSPFAGVTPAEVAAQRLVADVAPPGERVDGIPRALDEVIVTATRRDPDDRFADAGELAVALAPHVPDRPLQVVAEFANRVPARPAETRAITPVPVPPEPDADERTEVIPRTAGDEPDTDVSPGADATQVIPAASGADRTVALTVTPPRGRPARSAPPPTPPPPPPSPRRSAGRAVEGPPPDRPRRRGLWAGLAVVGVALVLAAALAEPSSTGGGPAGDGGQTDGAPAAEPYRIAGATDVDPYGGDGEHPEEVPLAFDGDPASAWRTQRYASAAFGGLKPGVGIAFDLGAPVPVSQVELLFRDGGADLQVHASAEPFQGTEFGPPVATAADVPTEVRLDVGGTEARYWLVWFTSAPGGRVELIEAEFDRPS